MDRIAQLNALISQFDLNTHPFYQDWRAGTLPMPALCDYAKEYRGFVATIATGWDTLGYNDLAEEEREHEAMWAVFQKELAAEGSPSRPSTDTLIRAAQNAFSSKPEAIGGLYAFEAQQPNTSRSKFDGLDEHYQLSEEAKEYFKVHADDVREAEILQAELSLLSDDEFARARTACAVVCAAMWGALDSVYYARA